jgi:hypothetical protein
MTETAISDSVFNYNPEFASFLRSRNLLTVQSFLLADFDVLADDCATRTNIDRPTSRDFIGAMEFRLNGLLPKRA